MAGTDRRRWVWESKGSRSKDMTLVVGNYHPNYSTDVLIHKRDKEKAEYFKNYHKRKVSLELEYIN